jgi:intracellular sulfur oxidation DsrE/DsrF family protein
MRRLKYPLVNLLSGFFTVPACISGKIRQAADEGFACLQAVWRDFYRSRIYLRKTA